MYKYIETIKKTRIIAIIILHVVLIEKDDTVFLHELETQSLLNLKPLDVVNDDDDDYDRNANSNANDKYIE